MKKLVSIVLCFVLLMSLATTAFAAEFTGSKTLVKDSVTEVKPKDAEGNEVSAEIKVVVPDVTTGERQSFKNRNEAAVMITDIAQVMESIEKEGDKAKDDKITKTGLTVAENKALAQVFETVKTTETTEKLMERVGVKAEDLAKVMPEGKTANDFAPAALFDVSMNEAAQKVIGENGSMEMKIAVPGIKAGDTILVMKLAADGSVIEGEFLEAVVNEDGTITFTMVGSGPVLILVNPAK